MKKPKNTKEAKAIIVDVAVDIRSARVAILEALMENNVEPAIAGVAALSIAAQLAKDSGSSLREFVKAAEEAFTTTTRTAEKGN